MNEYRGWNAARVISVVLFGIAFILLMICTIEGFILPALLDALGVAVLIVSVILGIRKMRKIAAVVWLSWAVFSLVVFVLIGRLVLFVSLFPSLAAWVFALIAGVFTIMALIFYLVKKRTVFAVMAILHAGMMLICQILHMILGVGQAIFGSLYVAPILYYAADILIWITLAVLALTHQLPFGSTASQPAMYAQNHHAQNHHAQKPARAATHNDYDQELTPRYDPPVARQHYAQPAPRPQQAQHAARQHQAPAAPQASPDSQMARSIKKLNAMRNARQISEQQYWARRKQILAGYRGNKYADILASLDAGYTCGKLSATEYKARNEHILSKFP